MAGNGMLARIFSRVFGAKAVTNPREWFDTTATASDLSGGRWKTGNVEKYLARAVGTAGICAHLNAQALAALPYRLYRKAGTGSTRGRKLTRAEKRWLSNGKPGVGPGSKAAIMAENAGDYEEVMDHPALEILRDPNGMDQGFQFWEFHHAVKELAGNAYCLIVTEPGQRVQLYTMYPQWVRVQPSRDGLIGSYWYGRDRASERNFDAEDVLHDMFEKSIYSPYLGSSPMERVFPEVELRGMMNQYAGALFANMTKPDALFSFKGTLTEDQIKRTAESIGRMYSGVDKAGRFAIAHGDMSVSSLGSTMNDLQFIEGRQRLDSEIATAYGVPETFLRPNDGALSQLQHARVLHGERAVLPRAIKFAEFLTESVLPLVDETPGLWFAPDNPVPGDETATATRLVSMVGGGILTPNEARAEMGYEPIEEGDELRTNQPAPGFGGFGPAQPPSPARGQVDAPEAEDPVEPPNPEDAAKSAPLPDRPADSGPIRPTDPRKPGDAEPVATDPPASTFGAEAEAAVTDPPPEPPADCGCGKAHGAIVSHKDLWYGDATHKGIEVSPFYDDAPDSLESAIAKFFRMQRDAILGAMKSKPNGHQRGGPRVGRKAATPAEVQRLMRAWGVTDEKWTSILLDTIKGPIDERLAAAAVMGAQKLEALGAVLDRPPETFVQPQNPQAKRFIDRHTADLLKGLESINQSTADAIAATLSEGVNNGESIDSLRQRVSAAFDAETPDGEPISRYRANMIARTETARAQEAGTLSSWADSEVVAGKKWLLNENACFTAGSQVIKIDCGAMISVGIETLRPGDLVLSAGGRAATVSAIRSRHHDGDIIVGRGFAVTPDHRFLTHDGWMPVGEYARETVIRRGLKFLIGKAKNLPATLGQVVSLPLVFGRNLWAIVPVKAVTKNHHPPISNHKVNDPSSVHGNLFFKLRAYAAEHFGHLYFNVCPALAGVQCYDVAVSGAEIVTPSSVGGQPARPFLKLDSARMAHTLNHPAGAGHLDAMGDASARAGTELLVNPIAVIEAGNKQLLAPLAGLFGRHIDTTSAGDSFGIKPASRATKPLRTLARAVRYFLGLATYATLDNHRAIVTHLVRLRKAYRGLVYDIEVAGEHSFTLACGLIAHNCEFCEAAAAQFNDQAVPLETPFYQVGSTLTGTDGGLLRIDFAAVMAPPLHPHDKCTIVPVLK